MCGIAGAITPTPPSQECIEATIAVLANRGPDASGFANRRLGDSNLCLIHTRLAIIDLDHRANQPFEREDCVLIFNGEIYNYLELKDELGALGHAFDTDSDTEVLLSAYREWGEDCVERFEGMWAFALLDAKAEKVLLSRDPFGEKPLYVQKIDAGLYFASEIKALALLSGRKPEVNTTQILRYLIDGYRFLYKGTDTFFIGVRELPAATNAVLKNAKEPAPKPYWRLAYAPTPMTAADAIAGARERLFESLRLRLRADVPLAFCLSGGIDSATLAAIAAIHFGHDIHCFSIIDRDDRYDETVNIKAMVEHLACNHHVTHTSTVGFFKRMERLVTYHDAPVATISYYVHSFLSEAISDNGFKVAVSGTGADELFTGYYDHYAMWLAHMQNLAKSDTSIDMQSLVADWKSGMGAHVQNPLLQDPLAFVNAPGQRDHLFLNRDYFNSLMTQPFDDPFSEADHGSDLLRCRMLNELFHEVIPVILHEDDRNSMMVSVENRTPYLDRTLARFLYSVPSEHLMRDGFTKRLLREAGKGLVPDSVRLDKRKRGFNASIGSLVNLNDAKSRERLLSDGPIFNLIRRDKIEQFFAGDMTSNSFSKFLFSFISAKIFLEHHQAWTP